MPDPGPLQQAIAALEASRPQLGDAAVDAAIEALRRHAHAQASRDAQAQTPPQRLRQVSILFADIAGSTALLGRLGAEDAMDLIGRALQGFADAVRAWDGEVLQFTGDGIKAAFGARGLREDEAERAVRAGLQILEHGARHAEQTERELGVTGFGVRVGIHTGPVLLGGGVEAERSAMGHAVHMAARMEQSAPIGRLRVSDATWAHVRGLFRAEPQPPLAVKGHDEPLATWIVVGAVSNPEAAVERGIEGVSTPMIGRDAELERLIEWHARAGREGRTLAALVVGEAGVGKTRLRRELLRALEVSEGSAGLLQARAHPSGTLQPYGLLRQLVARWLGIRDDEPAADARRKLVDGLAPWLGADAAQKAARIGALIGLDFGDHPAVQALAPSMLQRLAFEALRDALHARARLVLDERSRGAAGSPREGSALLLVLDDLHWADDASLAFVRTLLAPAVVPLMLLMLARPSLRERAGALDVEPGFDVATIELGALGTAGSEQLVRALLAGLPAAPASLQRLLLERTGGNPFFLEALVQMLIDDGVIDARARPWTLRADRLAALRVPPTLVSVLQARLDALPAGELLALQEASIVGAVFWRDALQALDAAAPAALPSLERRALVATREASAFADTDELGFAHQLLHETTYGTVLKEQRRAGHARVASWLAARLGDRAGEFLAITAEHYERAGDSAQALEYWSRAASDATTRYANRSALELVERALAQPALVDARWRFHLMATRHTLLDRLGLGEQAAAALDARAAFAEAQDDDAMRADVLTSRMLRADHEGRPQEARALAERILELAARTTGTFAPAAAALAHGELAWLALQRDDFEETARQVAAGIVHAREAARVPKRYGGYRNYEQQLRAVAISALLEQERYAAGLQAVYEAQAELDEKSPLQDRVNLLVRECEALRRLGRLDEASERATRLLELAERIGVARLLPAAREMHASITWWRGDLDRLADELVEWERAAGAIDGGFELPRVRALQAELAVARGDDELAHERWLDAVERYVAQGRPRHAQPSRAALAGFSLRCGRIEAAREAVDALLREAAQDARPHRRALQPEALLACHRVLAALGDPRADSLRDDLHARLDEQLAALADDASRRRLVGNVPHWRETAALLGRALPAGALAT